MEAMKAAAKIRQDGTPAYKLIYDSFGKHIERAFGEGVFGRLEREMFTKAKESLRNDPCARARVISCFSWCWLRGLGVGVVEMGDERTSESRSSAQTISII